MTTVSSENYWYELATVGDATGRPVRKYFVTCRDCGRREGFGAHDMSTEAMRKRFISKGWDIAKHRNHHLCPDCIEKRTERKREKREEKRERREIKRLEQRGGVPGISRLETAWINASEEERQRFFAEHFAADIVAQANRDAAHIVHLNEIIRAHIT